MYLIIFQSWLIELCIAMSAKFIIEITIKKDTVKTILIIPISLIALILGLCTDLFAEWARNSHSSFRQLIMTPYEIVDIVFYSSDASIMMICLSTLWINRKEIFDPDRQ